MARASYHIPNFLGGEWSARAQGNLSDPRYSTAMNVCINYYPVEEGTLIRRPNWRMGGATNLGSPGKLFPVTFQGGGLAQAEITYNSNAGASILRIWVP